MSVFVTTSESDMKLLVAIIGAALCSGCFIAEPLQKVEEGKDTTDWADCMAKCAEGPCSNNKVPQCYDCRNKCGIVK